MSPSGPGVPFPPTLYFVIACAIGLAMHDWQAWPVSPGESARTTRLWAAWSLLAIGWAIFFWGMATFAGARTGIMLERPAEGLVVRGPYRWSRNPMYVGYVIAYLGFAVLFNSVWPVVVLPAALVVLQATTIRREERYLRSIFGDEYEAYCRRVRRWV